MLTILKKNKDKLYEEDDDNNYVIQPSDRCIDLIDAVNLILDFNKTIQLDLVWKHKTRWMLIVWSVKKILKILIQKCLEQKNNKFHYDNYDDYYDYWDV